MIKNKQYLPNANKMRLLTESSKQRTKQVGAQVSESIHAKLKSNLDLKGMTISQWLREKIIKELEEN
jgi:hypothetical protein